MNLLNVFGLNMGKLNIDHKVPSAMVLIYMPELGNSVWQDFVCRARTISGLERKLKSGVRRGDWIAWRLIRVEKEVMGNC